MRKIILWSLSVFILLLSLVAFSEQFISGFLMLLAAVGCNPIFLNQLEKIGKKPKNRIHVPIIIALFIIGMMTTPNINSDTQNENVNTSNSKEIVENTTSQEVKKESKESQNNNTQEQQNSNLTVNNNTLEYNGKPYKIIVVDGGNLSGSRQAYVAVDIGFGDRIYWGLTNEYSQLIYVFADKVTLQDPSKEKVLSSGRYYSDEAKVPGTERSDLDEGHVIADSLGGVSNAYNITPQDSVLNRSGNQAYMEKVIRDAGGCTNFVATITYLDTSTQIPSHYHYEYVLRGDQVIDDFDNVNPDQVIAQTQAPVQAPVQAPTPAPVQAPVQEPVQPAVVFDEKAELNKVDSNHNGTVTIAEAKAAGYKMPIYSKDWIYKYMTDADGDGMVGEN